MAIDTVLSGASLALRLGAVAASAVEARSALDASFRFEDLQNKALLTEAAEVTARVNTLASERLASVQRDIGEVTTTAAALGVVGGASLATARATIGSSAAAEQAKTAATAAKTLKKISIQRRELALKAKAERRNIRLAPVGELLGQSVGSAQDISRITFGGED